jgi:hypothetical protein
MLPLNRVGILQGYGEMYATPTGQDWQSHVQSRQACSDCTQTSDDACQIQQQVKTKGNQGKRQPHGNN